MGMGVKRVQVTSQGVSMQPEDRYVNVFYFQDAPPPGDLATLCAAVEGFYKDVPAGSSTPVMHYLSGISGYAGSNIRVYDLDDPMPRAPLIDWPMSVGGHAGSSSKNLPDEVALCLSYSAGPASGLPIARRRGRVYIGPFSDNALRTGEGVSTESAPAQALMDVIVDAASAMRSIAEGAGYSWSVWSPTDQLATTIVDWHVDNAWDTQRRRGNKPTARVSDSV